MEFVLALCVIYCISMTIVCGFFSFRHEFFRDVSEMCFAIKLSNFPTSGLTEGATNVSKNM